MTDKETHPESRSAGISPWPLDRTKCAVRLRTVLPSTKRALNFGVEQVLRIAEGCCNLDDSRDDLEIAMREALANALIHGNAFGSQKGIRLRCYAGREVGILVVISDEGSESISCSVFPGRAKTPGLSTMCVALSGRGLTNACYSPVDVEPLVASGELANAGVLTRLSARFHRFM